MRARISLPLAGGAVILAACSAAPEEQSDLEVGTDEPVDDVGAGATSDNDAVTEPEAVETDADTKTDADTDDRTDEATTGGVADLTEAIPGTWPVGDAGTVTFTIADGALVLDDLDLADGWTLVETEEEADEIEFEIRNGPREFDVDIELDSDGTIDLEIDYGIVCPVNG